MELKDERTASQQCFIEKGWLVTPKKHFPEHYTNLANSNFQCMRLSILLAFSLISFAVRAQDQSSTAVEKLFLHTDRTFYDAGDTIWFKAYCFLDGNWSKLSSQLHVQLVNKKDSTVASVFLPMVYGVGAAQISIPKRLKGDEYALYAYTDAMQAYGEKLAFKQKIEIRSASTAIRETINSKDVLMKFFPEGGDLVEGVESVVAFEMSDEKGRWITSKGEIVDEQNKVIAKFATEHKGWGSFYFMPAANKSYKAKCDVGNGRILFFALPSAKKEGVVLNVIDVPNGKQFTLTKNNLQNESLKKIKIQVQQNGETVYQANVLFNDLSYTGLIKTDSFNNGLLRITLTDASQAPLCERIAFVQHEKDLAAFIKPNQLQTDHYAKNSWNIQLTPGTKANLSVSVTDADLDNYNPTQNIKTALLLTGDLHGNITEPLAYFENQSDSVQRKLELLLLTTGWRRFLPEVKPLPSRFIKLAGKVVNPEKYKTAIIAKPSLNVAIKTKDNKTTWLSLDVDAKGNFMQDGILFYDTAKISYSMNGAKEKGEISFEMPKPAMRFTKTNEFLSQFEKQINVLDLYNAKADVMYGNELAAVLVKTKIKTVAEKLDEEFAKGVFSGGAGKVVPMEESFLGYPDFFAFLTGRYAGMNVERTGNDYLVTWRGSEMVFYVDEQQLDENAVASLSMSDIVMFKIIDPPFILNGSGFGLGTEGSPTVRGGGNSGAIAIYTRKANPFASPPFTTFGSLTMNGYTPVRQFYAPDYATITPSLNDQRVTLFWNPFLFTDSLGHATIPFYNNSRTKKYRVVVQGADYAGNLIYIEKILPPQKNGEMKQ